MLFPQQTLSIATEPHSSCVRVSYNNQAHAFGPGLNQDQFTRRITSKRIDTRTLASKVRRSSSTSCECPHALIADDDAFQHFYYLNLFQRSLTFDNSFANSRDVQVQTFFSGEEMLQKLTQVKECGCNNLRLVITDYSMGSDKLNGVQVCSQVRAAGYSGFVLLRTSETSESLKEAHGNLESLVSRRVISEIVSKSAMKESKEIIQRFMNR